MLNPERPATQDSMRITNIIEIKRLVTIPARVKRKIEKLKTLYHAIGGIRINNARI